MESVNRTELWQWLIEAETNERYYGLVTDVCRWFDLGVKFILVTAATSSLAAVIAESRHEKWLAWLSFVAAFFEVIVRPLVNWPEKEKLAEKWRQEWIDIREGFNSLWRAHFAYDEGSMVDIEPLIKRVVALEKAKGYIPHCHWVINYINSKVANRRIQQAPA